MMMNTAQFSGAALSEEEGEGATSLRPEQHDSTTTQQGIQSY